MYFHSPQNFFIGLLVKPKCWNWYKISSSNECGSTVGHYSGKQPLLRKFANREGNPANRKCFCNWNKMFLNVPFCAETNQWHVYLSTCLRCLIRNLLFREFLSWHSRFRSQITKAAQEEEANETVPCTYILK